MPPKHNSPDSHDRSFMLLTPVNRRARVMPLRVCGAGVWRGKDGSNVEVVLKMKIFRMVLMELDLSWDPGMNTETTQGTTLKQFVS